MSAGPATKMRETFGFIAAHSQAPTAIRSAAERVVMDLTPAELEAMDAAVPAHESALQNWRECVVVVARTGLNDLSDAEQELLLGTLLERAIQRRKEGGA